MHDAILYRDEARLITLIDIPLSFQQGQGTTARSKSAPPAELPYHSTEPKARKRQNLLNSFPQTELDYQKVIQTLAAAGLDVVRVSHGNEKWCLPRVILDVDSDGASHRATADLAAARLRWLETLTKDTEVPSLQIPLPPSILSPPQMSFRDLPDLVNAAICNPTAFPIFLTAAGLSFNIPSQCLFICSSIGQGLASFTHAVKLFLPKGSSRTKGSNFDFILMDPPWANRSVRRGKFYSTAENKQDDPFEQVLPVVQENLCELGLVAVWITNKAAIRLHVLEAMSDLGLSLYEEWIWVKITAKGVPVTALDGVWRRPYEILLIFRRHNDILAIQRRVVIAVPDIHSRKPCLKKLIEPYLPQPYRALEIFARNLTAGWWSWGDEVLKYQQDCYWDDVASVTSEKLQIS